MVANTTYYDLIVIVTLNHFRIMTLVEGQHTGTDTLFVDDERASVRDGLIFWGGG